MPRPRDENTHMINTLALKLCCLMCLEPSTLIHMLMFAYFSVVLTCQILDIYLCTLVYHEVNRMNVTVMNKRIWSKHIKPGEDKNCGDPLTHPEAD